MLETGVETEDGFETNFKMFHLDENAAPILIRRCFFCRRSKKKFHSNCEAGDTDDAEDGKEDDDEEGEEEKEEEEIEKEEEKEEEQEEEEDEEEGEEDEKKHKRNKKKK